MHIVQKMEEKKLIHPPKWLSNNTLYLTAMGSMAYGCNEDDSDIDIYGYCIPPKEEVFRIGEIPGFGRQLKRFEQWQQAHVIDPDGRKNKGQEYDFTVYSIVKFFNLLMENNPNIVDSVFTPRECVIHSTQISEHIRDNRKLFLHKGLWHKFRGYAYAQSQKIKTKTPEPGSRREEYINKYGYDVKYAVHLVRLILECEQALVEGDIDLRRHSDLLRSIRQGAWTEEQVMQWFYDKEKVLEQIYHETKVLPYSPPEDKIRELLLECLEIHYGSLKDVVVDESKYKKALMRIKDLTEWAL